MKIDTTNLSRTFPTPEPRPGSSDGLFGALLHRAENADVRRSTAAGDRGESSEASQRARQAAVDLVSITFVEPILRQARETRSSEPPFGQTQAERQFGSLMDAQTARRIVESWDMPLVQRIASDIASRSGAMTEAVQ